LRNEGLVDVLRKADNEGTQVYHPQTKEGRKAGNPTPRRTQKNRFLWKSVPQPTLSILFDLQESRSLMKALMAGSDGVTRGRTVNVSRRQMSLTFGLRMPRYACCVAQPRRNIMRFETYWWQELMLLMFDWWGCYMRTVFGARPIDMFT